MTHYMRSLGNNFPFDVTVADSAVWSMWHFIYQPLPTGNAWALHLKSLLPIHYFRGLASGGSDELSCYSIWHFMMGEKWLCIFWQLALFTKSTADFEFEREIVWSLLDIINLFCAKNWTDLFSSHNLFKGLTSVNLFKGIQMGRKVSTWQLFRQLTALIRESNTLTANAVPQANGWVRYSSVSGSSSSSWSKNWTLESFTAVKIQKL